MKKNICNKYVNKKILTDVVKNVKVNGIYQAHNLDLKLGLDHCFKHDIIVCSINKKRKTAKVKTITSLEYYDENKKRFKFRGSSRYDLKNGNILPIPIKQLKSQHYSGIHHNAKIIPLCKIHYKDEGDKTRFPNRYYKLIYRK